MTAEEADRLYGHLRQMSLPQLFALWRLIYLIIRHRLDAGADAEIPSPVPQRI